ncbi:MAG: TVP38/TMEM64 family protein [Actinobacteria bacterium]|nr:MAG: TVP38/TMEM64 family protein [Actinomycetota bacterium]
MRVRTSRKQALTFFILAAAALGAYALVPGVRQGVATAFSVLGRGDVRALKSYLLSFGPAAPIVSGLLMVFQSVIAPLPAFVITFTNGLLFGAWWGALLSWSSSMAGAAICFWIARVLGRPTVERLVGGGRALDASDRFFDRYGDKTVLVTRLLPFVSFDVISYGAGLTPLGFWRFFVATGIGQLPATLVYSYLGQNLTGSVKVVFFTFIAILVLLVLSSTLKPLYERRIRSKSENGPAVPPATVHPPRHEARPEEIAAPEGTRP